MVLVGFVVNFLTQIFAPGAWWPVAVYGALVAEEAGADGIFAEAVHTLDDYKAFSDGINGAHLLANITEFGATPLFNTKELAENGATGECDKRL